MVIGFLLFPGVEELDLAGPWEILSLWASGSKEHRCVLISEHSDPVRCARGMLIVPDHTFSDCPPLEYLLVPGGGGTAAAAENPVLLNFIKERADSLKGILSVCTGTFILQRAGLLAGRKATTHWMRMDQLRALPDVEVVDERIVHDGNIWTAAGVSAGIDLAFRLIEHITGPEIAGKVQLGAEYFPERLNFFNLKSMDRGPGYVKKGGGDVTA